MDKEPQVDAETTAEETPAAGQEIAVATPQTGASLIIGRTPEEVLDVAGKIATPLAKLIDDKGLFANMGGGKKHVEISAWQACGAMMGALGGQSLHAETVWSRPVVDGKGEAIVTRYDVHETRKKWGGPKGDRQVVETIERDYTVEGHDFHSRVEIRNASGAVAGIAEAMVSRSESAWAERQDPALMSMAETRAESRAYRRAIGWIVTMAGYSATPAEEMPGHVPGQTAAAPKLEHPHGEPAGEDLARRFVGALRHLLGQETGDRTATAIYADCGGYLPQKVARGVGLAVTAEKARRVELVHERGEEPSVDAEVVDAEPVTDSEHKADESIPF